MSLSAAVIDALVAAGATAEQLAAAMKADLAEAEQRKTEKRAKDATRQRKSRASRNVTVTPRDMNGHGVTACDAPALDKENPQTPKEINPTPLPPAISDEMAPPAAENERIELKPDHVIEAWNDLAQRFGLPVVKKLTESRRRQLVSRIRQNSIEEFQAAFAAIERSSFLRGENDRGWRADFDFVLQPKTFTKLIEGAYDH